MSQSESREGSRGEKEAGVIVPCLREASLIHPESKSRDESRREEEEADVPYP